jgi:hypothetical protein
MTNYTTLYDICQAFPFLKIYPQASNHAYSTIRRHCSEDLQEKLPSKKTNSFIAVFIAFDSSALAMIKVWDKVNFERGILSGVRFATGIQ